MPPLGLMQGSKGSTGQVDWLVTCSGRSGSRQRLLCRAAKVERHWPASPGRKRSADCAAHQRCHVGHVQLPTTSHGSKAPPSPLPPTHLLSTHVERVLRHHLVLQLPQVVLKVLGLQAEARQMQAGRQAGGATPDVRGLNEAAAARKVSCTGWQCGHTPCQPPCQPPACCYI